MPRSSDTTFASPAHEAAFRVLTTYFKDRAVTGTPYHLGPVYSQAYPSGPVKWRVSLHTDDKGGRGQHAAQLTIECRDKTGEVAVFGEPRRNPKTGDRYAPTPAHLDFLTKVAPKVEFRLADTDDYANPDPKFLTRAKKAPRLGEATPQATTIFDLFGTDND